MTRSPDAKGPRPWPARRSPSLARSSPSRVPRAPMPRAPADPGTGPPSRRSGRHATELVLRVATEGGFTPVEYHLTNLPAFSLYGDGTIVTPGPQIEIYPGPGAARAPGADGRRSGDRAILTAAIDAGLDSAGDLTDMGSVVIADAPTPSSRCTPTASTRRSGSTP